MNEQVPIAVKDKCCFRIPLQVGIKLLGLVYVFNVVASISQWRLFESLNSDNYDSDKIFFSCWKIPRGDNFDPDLEKCLGVDHKFIPHYRSADADI